MSDVSTNDERSQACIILSENRRTKNGGSLGTRLIIWRLYSPWLSLFPPPYLNRLFVLCFRLFVLCFWLFVSHSKVQWHHAWPCKHGLLCIPRLKRSCTWSHIGSTSPICWLSHGKSMMGTRHRQTGTWRTMHDSSKLWQPHWFAMHTKVDHSLF